MSFISLFITVSDIGKSRRYSPPLWKCAVSPRGHKIALIKLSCNIFDLLKHNWNYICMPVVPQLTIMRYFHHFSPVAKGRLRDLRNAITLTETTERLTGLICCILNNNNPQNGSRRFPKAKPTRRENNSDQLRHMPTKNYCTSKERRLLTGCCGFFVSSVKTTRNGWICVTGINQRRRSRPNCPVSCKWAPRGGRYRRIRNDLGWSASGYNKTVNERVNEARARARSGECICL